MAESRVCCKVKVSGGSDCHKARRGFIFESLNYSNMGMTEAGTKLERLPGYASGGESGYAILAPAEWTGEVLSHIFIMFDTVRYRRYAMCMVAHPCAIASSMDSRYSRVNGPIGCTFPINADSVNVVFWQTPDGICGLQEMLLYFSLMMRTERRAI